MNISKIAFFSCIFFTIFLLADSIYKFDSTVDEKRFYSLISEIRCPKCTSGSIASSDVPVSRDLKQKVYELILAGSTDKEIKAYVTERFGASSDYKPAFEGANYLLWFGPFIFLGILMLIFLLNRKL